MDTFQRLKLKIEIYKFEGPVIIRSKILKTGSSSYIQADRVVLASIKAEPQIVVPRFQFFIIYYLYFLSAYIECSIAYCTIGSSDLSILWIVSKVLTSISREFIFMVL